MQTYYIEELHVTFTLHTVSYLHYIHFHSHTRSKKYISKISEHLKHVINNGKIVSINKKCNCRKYSYLDIMIIICALNDIIYIYF